LAIDEDHITWLAGLRHPVTLSLDRFGDVVFCHGTPHDDAKSSLSTPA
jgi:hypothetical protein